MESGASAFSSNEAAVIERSLDTNNISAASSSFDLDIAATAAHIRRLKVHRIALQFPDGLLSHASAAVAALSAELASEDGLQIFVLGDTSFDGFQVDYVAAQHLGAEMLVHYGPVDLEAEGPLPVRFVLGRQSLDVNALAAACSTIFGGGGRVLVVPSLPYVHAAFDLAAALATACPSAIVCGADIERDAEPTGPPPPPAAAASSSDGANDDALGVSSDLSRGRLLGRTLPVPLSEEDLQSSELSLLYVGTEEEQTLSNLCMLLPNAAVHLCTPPSGSSGSGDGVGDSRGGSAGGSGGVWDRYAADTSGTNGHDSGDTDQQQLAITRLSLPTAKRLMRRYYLVHKAREAEIVGILVGTLSASKRKDMLSSLKKLLKSSGRKVRAASTARKHTALPSSKHRTSSTPRSHLTTDHSPRTTSLSLPCPPKVVHLRDGQAQRRKARQFHRGRSVRAAWLM